jgi:Mo-dependent nitrogenase C-terminus
MNNLPKIAVINIATLKATTNTSNIMVSNLSKLAQLLATRLMSQSKFDLLHLPKFDLFKPLRGWLENLNISNPQLAHRLCKLIPSQCPFERDVSFFGRTLLHIPPMCKLNPLYDEVVMLRFKAMCYLADECGEDISQYC